MIEDALMVMQQTVITPENSGVCEALKLHVASVYLEELDYAGDLPQEQVIDFLRPYVRLLQKPNTS